MNWSNLLSAVLGATIGGIFLLGSQEYSKISEARKIRKILFSELFNNCSRLDDFMETVIEQGRGRTHIFQFNISTDLFKSFENEYLSLVPMNEYSQIVQPYNIILFKKNEIRSWERRYLEHSLNENDYFLSAQILIYLQKEILDKINVLTEHINKKELEGINYFDWHRKYHDRVSYFENIDDKPRLILILPQLESNPA